MSENWSRRGFLGTSALASLGFALGCGGSEPALETLIMPEINRFPPLYRDEELIPVTIRVLRTENPLFHPEAYDIVRNYLRDDVGLDVTLDFEELNESNLHVLGDRNVLAIAELSEKFGIEREYERIRVTPEEASTISDFDDWVVRQVDERDFGPTEFANSEFEAFQSSTYEGMSLYQAVERFNEFMELVASRHPNLASGRADREGNTAEVWSSNTHERTLYLRMHDNFTVFDIPGYDNVRSRSFEGTDQTAQQLEARLILHELLHLTGLWHNPDFTNDGVLSYVQFGDDPVSCFGISGCFDGVPNIMWPQVWNLGESRYGFDLTSFQKDWVRGFFKKEKPFELYQSGFQEDGTFNFGIFMDNIARTYRFER